VITLTVNNDEFPPSNNPGPQKTQRTDMDTDHFERVQKGMCAEIERACKGGAVMATAALIYLFIDAMA
jgi:hypothetical protein